MKWFGEPWPSGICYGDDGQLLAGSRTCVPVGAPCGGCEEPIGVDEAGVEVPHLTAEFRQSVLFWHKECWLRAGVGGLAHQRRVCSCFGPQGPDPAAGMSRREEALAVWAWVHEHGV